MRSWWCRPEAEPQTDACTGEQSRQGLQWLPHGLESSPLCTDPLEKHLST